MEKFLDEQLDISEDKKIENQEDVFVVNGNQDQTIEDSSKGEISFDDTRKKDQNKLKEVREELGILIKTEDDEVDIKEKIKIELQKEFMSDFEIFYRIIKEFKDELKINKFNNIPLDLDSLERVSLGGFDSRLITEVFREVGSAFKKDFLPTDLEKRLSIGKNNYNNIIDLLDSLKTQLVKIRKFVENKNISDDAKNAGLMEDEVSAFLRIVNRQKEHLLEMQFMLGKFSGW